VKTWQIVTVGLVLGAGGLVGVAHHVGVLTALEREAGFAARDADLVIGTSAGAAIGAYLRSGWDAEDLWGRVKSLELVAPTGAAGGPLEFARRVIGSGYVLARSGTPAPVRRLLRDVPRPLRRAFPAGLFTMGSGPSLLEADLPADWPDKPLWLCAYDLESGRRVVLGKNRAQRPSLARAVMASCAIPGVYRPVRVGSWVLVDGGVHSLTNLDLAVGFGCDVVVCVAPLAGGLGSRPAWSGPELMRIWPSAALRAEVTDANREGTRVVVLAPGAAEVREHGYNLMRATGLERVALAAYDATARSLAASDLASLLSRRLRPVDGEGRGEPVPRAQGRGNTPITVLRACPPTGGTSATTR
jgi:NTE family protein